MEGANMGVFFKRSHRFLLLLSLLFLFTGCGGGNRRRDYREDFQFLVKTVEEDYIYSFTPRTREWLSKKEEYEKAIAACKNDEEFLRTLNEALQELAPFTHTAALDRQTYEGRLPLFTKSLQEGNPLHQFGTETLQEMISDETKETYKVLSSPFGKKEEGLNEGSFSPRPVLECHSLVPRRLGYIFIPSMPPYDEKSVESSYPLDKKVLEDFMKTIDEDGALILDVRSCPGGDSRYWQEFLLPYLMDIPEVTWKEMSLSRKHYIDSLREKKSDNRLNRDYASLEDVQQKEFPLLQEIVETGEGKEVIALDSGRPEVNRVHMTYKGSEEPFRGRLYVLMDEYTFSSALLLVEYVKAGNFATLLGEPAHAARDWYDLYKLPRTGYIVQLSTACSIAEDTTLERLFEVSPDLYIQDGKKHLWVQQDGTVHAETDQAIQKVLQLEGLRE